MEPVFVAFAAILSALMPFDMGPGRPAQPPQEIQAAKPSTSHTCQSSYLRTSRYEERNGKVVVDRSDESASPTKCGEPLDRRFDDLKASIVGRPERRVERF